MNNPKSAAESKELLAEIFDDATACFYMTLEGINVSSDDPIIGELTTTLFIKHEIDNTSNKREYPKPGDRLENYHVNRETGAYYITQSHWVVYEVEIFPNSNPQIMREVVIAWCRLSPIAQKTQV